MRSRFAAMLAYATLDPSSDIHELGRGLCETIAPWRARERSVGSGAALTPTKDTGGYVNLWTRVAATNNRSAAAYMGIQNLSIGLLRENIRTVRATAISQHNQCGYMGNRHHTGGPARSSDSKGLETLSGATPGIILQANRLRGTHGSEPAPRNAGSPNSHMD